MIAKLGGRKTLITIICLVAGVAIDLATSRGLSENLLYAVYLVDAVYPILLPCIRSLRGASCTYAVSDATVLTWTAKSYSNHVNGSRFIRRSSRGIRRQHHLV